MREIKCFKDTLFHIKFVIAREKCAQNLLGVIT